MTKLETRLSALETRLAKLERINRRRLGDAKLSPISAARSDLLRAMTEYYKARSTAGGTPPETLESINRSTAWYKAATAKLLTEAAKRDCDEEVK